MSEWAPSNDGLCDIAYFGFLKNFAFTNSSAVLYFLASARRLASVVFASFLQEGLWFWISSLGQTFRVYQRFLCQRSARHLGAYFVRPFSIERYYGFAVLHRMLPPYHRESGGEYGGFIGRDANRWFSPLSFSPSHPFRLLMRRSVI